MRTPALLPTLGLVALACNGGGNGNGNGDDTDPQFDPGCILVDDGGGYANLVDALTVADDGATITLCDVVDEEVIVDKAVTIVGEGMTLQPPNNVPAITVVDGGDLTISDVLVETTRSGFLVEQGGRLHLSDATLEDVPNYGVDVQAGGEAVVENVTMRRTVWGGVRVDGGTLTLTDSTLELRGQALDDSGSYGVLVENDGTATLVGNTISGAILKSTESDVFAIDGVGVWATSGATVELDGNTLTGNDIAGVSANGATLTLRGDAIDQTLGGVVGRQSSITAEAVTIRDHRRWGLLCVQCDTFDLTSVDVETTRQGSIPNDPENDARGSMGVLAIGTDAVISGTPEAPSRFVGHHGAGVEVGPIQGGGDVVAEISDTIIEDNAAFGLVGFSSELTVRDTRVSTTSNDDDFCLIVNADGSTSLRCNMGLAMINTSGTLENVTVEDSEFWGLTVLNGVADVIGGTIRRNLSTGVRSQSSAVTFDGTTFSEGREYQLIIGEGSTAVIQNSTFEDGAFDREFVNEFEDGEGNTRTTRTVSYYSAREATVTDSSLVLTNSTLRNGQEGFVVSTGGVLTAEDVTVEGYNEQVFTTFSDGELDLTRVSMSDVGQQALYCSRGSLTADAVSISNMGKYDYRYEYFQDGELLFDNQFSRPGWAVFLSTCSATLEDVVIDGSDGSGLYASNSTLETDGLTLRDLYRDLETSLGQGAVDLQWSRRTDGDGNVLPESVPTAILNGITVDGLGTYPEGSGRQPPIGVSLRGWTLPPDDAENPGGLPESTVSLRDLRINPTEGASAPGQGLRAQYLADLRIDGLDIQGVDGHGLEILESNATLVGATAGRGGTIDATGGDGLVFNGQRTTVDPTPLTLSAADITITGAGGDGFSILGGADHSLTGVTVTGATAWGATCAAEPTFATCDASLDGGLGATDGCDVCSIIE
jgi:hypothetical protein